MKVMEVMENNRGGGSWSTYLERRFGALEGFGKKEEVFLGKSHLGGVSFSCGRMLKCNNRIGLIHRRSIRL